MSALPPLPAGFVLDTSPPSGGALPPLPPGFQLEQGPPAPAAPPAPSGAYNNATAGLNDTLYRIAGAPVDIINTAMRAGAAGLHALGGPDIELPVDTIGGHQSIADVFAKLGTNDPAKVQANGEADKLARAAGAGVGAAVAPEAALAGLAKLGIVGPAAAELASRLVGGAETPAATAVNAAAGATSGVGAQAASDVAPEPLKPLAAVAGGLAGGAIVAAPAAAKAAIEPIIGKAAQPFTAAGRQAAAGQTLVDAATNPQAAVQSLDQDGSHGIPGYQPTAGQQAGDMGLLGLERRMETAAPEPFQQRRADQNAARVTAQQGIQATGAPEQVAQAVRAHIDAIGQQADQDAQAATQQAVAQAEAVGTPLSPEATGAIAKQAYEAARAPVRDQERALWKAVDPDGTLTVGISPVKAQVAQTLKEVTPLSAKPSGEEQAVYSDVLKMPSDSTSLTDVQGLQSRLKTMIRDEVQAHGESPAWRRLSMLNGAVQDTLDNAVAQRVKEDNAAVAAGTLAPQDAIAAKLNDWVASWRARQSAEASGAARRTSYLGNGPEAGSAAAGLSGTARQAGNQFGGDASAPGLSSDAGGTPVDEAALGRLNAARTATRERVATFDNPTLAPLHKTGPNALGNSAVPERLFFPGAKSVDAIKTYQKAVGADRALQVLEPYAVDRLRLAALEPDGTLNAARTASWLRSHSDALSAFPALKSRVLAAAQGSAKAADVAKAGAATVKAAQEGVLGKITGLSDPQDVARAVGAIFRRDDSVKQMMLLRKAIGANKDAQEGLRKAIADYISTQFISNTEAGVSGKTLLKSDQFQTFLRTGRKALEVAGFAKEQVDMMDRIAASMQEANRSITAIKLPGRSNTAQDVLAAKAADSKGTLLTKIIMSASLGGGGILGGAAVGNLPGAVIGGVAGSIIAPWLAAIRQSGLDQIDELVRRALLDPSLARQLMLKVPPAQTESALIKIGQRYARSTAQGYVAAR